MEAAAADHLLNDAAHEHAQLLERRMETYVRVLLDLRALFATSDSVSPGQLEAYVQDLHVDRDYPGIARIGYAMRVPAADRAAHERAMRRSGYAGYRIQTNGVRDAYYPFVFSYPGNTPAQRQIRGLDMGMLPGRWPIMMRALDTGRAVASDGLYIASDTRQRMAMIVVAPVFRRGAALATRAERRQALRGYVYESFFIGDLLAGLFGKDFKPNPLLDLRLYDGPDPAHDELLYSTDTPREPAGAPRQRAVAVLAIADGANALALLPKAGFYAAHRSELPAAVLAVGLLLSLLVTGISWQAAMRRRLLQAHAEFDQRFRSLFDQNPDAVYSIGLDGKFINVNTATCRLLGRTAAALAGASVVEFFSPECQAVAGERLKQAADGQSTHGEAVVINAHGQRIEVATTLVPIIVNGRRIGIFSIAKDITARKQAERALKQAHDELEGRVAARTEELRAEVSARRISEGKYRLLFEEAPVGIVHVGLAGEWLMVNPRGCEILGQSADGLAKVSFFDMLSPAGDETALEHVLHLRQGLAESAAWENRHVRPDGAVIWTNIHLRPACTEDGEARHYIAIIEDITERKRTEEALRELTRHLETVREEERSRIAREIHDDLGGALTAVKFDLSQPAQGDAAATARNQRSIRLVDMAMASMRRIIADLRPGVLDDMGLWAALEWLLDDFSERTGIRCEYDFSGEETAPEPNQATAIFRIVQEALTNVAKHAQATRVSVLAYASEAGIEISIEDNGTGLSRDDLVKRQSFGIRGQLERARLFNGTVQINSRPGAGTCVEISFPAACNHPAGNPIAPQP